MQNIDSDVQKNIVTRKKKDRFHISADKQLTLMVIPFILFIVVFGYIPILGWSMAFVRYIPGIPILESKFIGFNNFKLLFGFASDFPRIIINTLAMSFLGILFSPIPVILALLLSEVKNNRFRKFIQTATSLPNFISMVIVFSLFFQMFSLDGGFINEILLKLKIIDQPLNILGNPEITWYVQTFIGLWKGAGWSAIIYIAAIASIDQEQYEAARVDGANRFQQAIHITLPGIIATYVVLLLLSMANILSGSFEQIYVFHNPLVASKIENLDYYAYKIGLGMYDFSLSTAIGMFKSLLSIILLFVFSKISKTLTGSSVI